ARRHALQLARADHRGVAEAVLVLERALEHAGHDLHVAVRVSPEAAARLDPVLVDHPQRAEAQVARVVVVGERERVPAREPAVLGAAPVVAPAQLDHPATIGQRPRPGSTLVIVVTNHYTPSVAFLVRRPDGRIEIRESLATPAGPRARTLASVRGP